MKESGTVRETADERYALIWGTIRSGAAANVGGRAVGGEVVAAPAAAAVNNHLITSTFLAWCTASGHEAAVSRSRGSVGSDLSLFRIWLMIASARLGSPSK